ncbi:hypothetical protein QV08_01595 [Gallibacterium salpingitidis]|uniref:HTH tetR-type domain-containing protein n=1 Tax=Gallibacterium salpingitidis TaxID=505341 RepID=A0AB36E172_9PAST|nr:TetR/AcrR family transcriptional regulator [Gallibacterium salpingitidis]OBX09086.1 hypothetical protein QV09_08680 [Gallibacterium salpingitidis]OBX09653.1 hypothetical protein QV08_01595 [Gallibacterium salpingitidis]WKT00812.1 TetR/AcrR family transcriptional regulator [Gallibacterium salpingitidis]
MKTTKQKLMEAIVDLVAEKGFRAVTTLEIAQRAGVGEKTLFRNFSNKLSLLEEACNQVYYAAEFKVIIENELVYDLKKDLMLIFTQYHLIANKNRKILMIALKEEDQLPELRKKILEHPKSLLNDLVAYLDEMIRRNLMRKTDTRVAALLMVTAQYGAFINHLNSKRNFPDISLEEYIESSVEIFTKGLLL